MSQLQLTRAQEERAVELYHTSLIMDAMCGQIVAPEPPVVGGKTHLDRLLETNIRVLNISMTERSDDFKLALEEMFQYFNLFQITQDRTLHVKRVADIERAQREKKLGIIFAFQSPTPVDTHFYRWTILQQLGLRTCSLAYMEPNVMADGCLEPANRGLTFYGIQAVKEMNRLGIVVDLSHVGERSSLDALELSEKPCIFSHSNAKGLSLSQRNITDEQIKLLAKRGGVVGLSPFCFMTFKEVGKRSTLSDYLDHFDYVAKLVGTDHICIGTDVYESYTKFSWTMSTKLFYKTPWTFENRLSEGFSKITEIDNVVRGLVARDYSDDDIRKVLGGNLLRVFKAVWRDDF